MKKILLVEDDPFLLDIYTTKLEEEGFEVEKAEDGNSALRELRERKFDLMLLDIVLPKIDGWAILGEVRKDPEMKDLKVIILSNLSQKRDVEKGRKFRAEKYLIKAHFTPGEVIEEIKRALR